MMKNASQSPISMNSVHYDYDDDDDHHSDQAQTVPLWASYSHHKVLVPFSSSITPTHLFGRRDVEEDIPHCCLPSVEECTIMHQEASSCKFEKESSVTTRKRIIYGRLGHNRPRRFKTKSRFGSNNTNNNKRKKNIASRMVVVSSIVFLLSYYHDWSCSASASGASTAFVLPIQVDKKSTKPFGRTRHSRTVPTSKQQLFMVSSTIPFYKRHQSSRTTATSQNTIDYQEVQLVDTSTSTSKSTCASKRLSKTSIYIADASPLTSTTSVTSSSPAAIEPYGQQQQHQQEQISKCPIAKLNRLLGNTFSGLRSNQPHELHKNNPLITKHSTSESIIILNENNNNNNPATTGTTASTMVVPSRLLDDTMTNKKKKKNNDADFRANSDGAFPWEVAMVDWFEDRYQSVLVDVHCPFLRRRYCDALDTMENAVRNVFILRQREHILGPPPNLQCWNDDNDDDNNDYESKRIEVTEDYLFHKHLDNDHVLAKQPSHVSYNKKTTNIMKKKNKVGCTKNLYLSLDEVMEHIRNDWRTDTSKGYYITGKLNTTIYRNDCLFDGPDPDMPIRGLRKFVNAASQLFDYKTSSCELLSLSIQPTPTACATAVAVGGAAAVTVSSLPTTTVNTNQDDQHRYVIEAKWRMNGALRLPWKPSLPTVTGTTIYTADCTGLIATHIETWDNISAYQAFVHTLFPPGLMESVLSFWKRNQKKAKKRNSRTAA